MINIYINNDFMNSLYFETTGMGKSQFIQQNQRYFAQVSEKELDDFMRENNLITYKNELKQYENGEIVGTLEFLE